MGMCSCLLSPSLEIKLLCDVIWVGLTPFPSTGSRQMTRVWSLCSILLDLKAGPCEASSSTWLSLWRGRFMFFFFFFSPGISNYKNNTELWVTSMSTCRESLPKNKVYTEKSMAKRWRVRLRFAIILFQLLVSAVTEASPTPLILIHEPVNAPFCCCSSQSGSSFHHLQLERPWLACYFIVAH